MHLLVVLLECLRAMLARRRPVPQPGAVPAESGGPRGGASPPGEPSAFQSWAGNVGPRRMTRWPDVEPHAARGRCAPGRDSLSPAVDGGWRVALAPAAWFGAWTTSAGVAIAPRRPVPATDSGGNFGPRRADRSQTANG